MRDSTAEVNRQAVIDAATQVEILHNLSARLRESYVFPELAEEICLHLQEQWEAGAYKDLQEGELLALALTMDMQDVAHDEHLWLRWHAESLPDSAGQLRLNQEWQAERRMEAGLDNYGIRQVERLPGNVGYMDIRYFHRAEWGRDAAMAALRSLANTQALIFDLRQCQGGYADMIALMCSSLLGDKPVHLDSIYWRDEDVTQEYWTQPEAPGVRFDNTPVYVLISKATFSGGEAFAYNLQAMQRARLIGEQTCGGAHPGASYRIHPHFEAFIPVGRVINPVTGTNWEGCGVSPDIPAPAEAAFPQAYRMALEKIIEDLSGTASGRPSRLLTEIQSALEDLDKPSEVGRINSP